MTISKKGMFLALLSLSTYSFGGSCNDHIKLNSIANIQTDGADVLVRSDSFLKGSTISWAIPTNSTFRLSGTSNTDFRKNSLAALLTAKSTGETVYLQISYVSAYTFQIEKVSVGASTIGLECGTYN